MKLRTLIVGLNEAPVLAHLVGACNVAYNAKSEWVTIRYGVYPNQVGLQVFDRDGASQMVAAFNSLSGRAADLFRGLPIYVGHPDDAGWAKANPGVRAEAVGRIREMRVADDGLQLRAAYNDEGKRLLTGDAPPYDSYSPNWGMLPAKHQGRAAFRPVELFSIGLTNHPNIPGSYIGLNEALPAEPISAMKKHIIALLAAIGRPVADAAAVTDEQLATAVNEATPIAAQLLTDNAQLATVKSQLTAAQSQVTSAVNESATLRTSLATERAARAGIVITRAINEGRVTEAQRAEWLGKFTTAGADFTAIESDLGKLKKAVNTQTQTGDLGSRRASTIESKKKISAINEAVTAKMEAAKCDRVTAYNTVRAEKPELFEPSATS
jgi:hypothetical protein